MALGEQPLGSVLPPVFPCVRASPAAVGGRFYSIGSTRAILDPKFVAQDSERPGIALPDCGGGPVRRRPRYRCRPPPCSRVSGRPDAGRCVQTVGQTVGPGTYSP